MPAETIHQRQGGGAGNRTGKQPDNEVGEVLRPASVPVLRVQEIVQKAEVVGDQYAADKKHGKRADHAKTAHKARHKGSQHLPQTARKGLWAAHQQHA